MNNQVGELTRLQEQVESVARKNNYLTSQLHSRALALLTDDMSINTEIANLKTRFSEELARAELKSPADKGEFFQRLRAANDRFTAAGLTVLSLQQAGDLDGALRAHIDMELRQRFSRTAVC
jgi:hypothetical protein